MKKREQLDRLVKTGSVLASYGFTIVELLIVVVVPNFSYTDPSAYQRRWSFDAPTLKAP